ncbi:hypothetical protein B296_00001548 [Ensete ventricosum]|uniref:Uncharacterized protein n=1 Tax=Ensete ventricosum TaxID=4639 RepID=A0A427AZ42_ENSVE|nr:hypothetical protein B296_00001548 [Ensete ventricosum]
MTDPIDRPRLVLDQTLRLPCSALPPLQAAGEEPGTEGSIYVGINRIRRKRQRRAGQEERFGGCLGRATKK